MRRRNLDFRRRWPINDKRHNRRNRLQKGNQKLLQRTFIIRRVQVVQLQHHLLLQVGRTQPDPTVIPATATTRRSSRQVGQWRVPWFHFGARIRFRMLRGAVQVCFTVIKAGRARIQSTTAVVREMRRRGVHGRAAGAARRHLLEGLISGDGGRGGEISRWHWNQRLTGGHQTASVRRKALFREAIHFLQWFLEKGRGRGSIKQVIIGSVNRVNCTLMNDVLSV